jgi:hypothetical protein
VPWAGDNYNHESTSGGRLSLRAVFNEGWSATLMAAVQQQRTTGAWDQDLGTTGRAR